MATAKKLAKKSFFEVKAPLISARTHVYGATIDEFEGKIVNLDLTRSLRGKSLELKLRIKRVGDSLEGEPISLILAGSYVRRMIRKGTDYVEDSFKTDCKDSLVIVKPFLITRNKVSRGIRKSLRETVKKAIETHLKTRTVMEVFSDIMSNRIQKDISLKAKKVYPLALCEIRVFEIITDKTEKKEEVKEEKKEVKKENIEVKEEKKIKPVKVPKVKKEEVVEENK